MIFARKRYFPDDSSAARLADNVWLSLQGRLYLFVHFSKIKPICTMKNKILCFIFSESCRCPESPRWVDHRLRFVWTGFGHPRQSEYLFVACRTKALDVRRSATCYNALQRRSTSSPIPRESVNMQFGIMPRNLASTE